jgi:hypothetical protein
LPEGCYRQVYVNKIRKSERHTVTERK